MAANQTARAGLGVNIGLLIVSAVSFLLNERFDNGSVMVSLNVLVGSV